MIRDNIKLRIVLTSILLVTGIVLSAQNRPSSPYSLFGIGRLNETFNARTMALGNTSFAMRDATLINFANPASYTAIDSLSFIFDGGFKSSVVSLKSDNYTDNVTGASLSHLTFGFQITKFWKSSFGLLPFSDVEYSISDFRVYDSIGNVQYLFEGSGGFNQVYWGNAFKIGKYISVGINAAYVFGTIDNEKAVNVIDNPFYLNTKVTNSISARDLYLTYGLQFYIPINDKLDLTIGGVYGAETNLNSVKDYLAKSVVLSSDGIDYSNDTLDFSPSATGNLTIPLKYGIGVSLRDKDKWQLAADFSQQKWEDYSAFGQNDSLFNSMRISIGFEVIPDSRSVFSYWERATYRVGLRYESTYLNLNENQLRDFGISFGMGLPLRKSKSTINFGVEFGQFGTTENELIRENYVRFTLGITMFQRWFEQSKYY